MRNIILAIALVLFCLSSRGDTLTTATLTITNIPANGATLSVNGNSRMFTNVITAASTQITTGTNIAGVQSNTFVQLASYPVSFVQLAKSSTNVITLRSYPGYNITVTPSSGWAYVTYITNSTGTNQYIIRAPVDVTGLTERSNVTAAIVNYLNGAWAGTNVISSNAPAFAYFQPPNLAGVTNLIYAVGLNGTNYINSVNTSLSNNIFTSANGLTNYVAGATAGINPALFQPSSDTLSNLATHAASDILSGTYLDSGNIVLKHTNLIERVRANEGGDLVLNDKNGTGLLTISTDGAASGITLFDGGGIQRFAAYYDSYNGATIIRSRNNVGKFVLWGDDTTTIQGVAAFSKPVAAYFDTWAGIAVTTTTNFFTTVGNSGSSDTTVNSFTVPSGTLLTDGDSVCRRIGVSLSSGTSTKRVQVYYAGTSIFDSGAMTMSGAGAISITCEVVRSGSGTVKYNSSATASGTTTTGFSKVGSISTSPDGSFYIVLTAGGTGPDDNQLQVFTDHTQLRIDPSAALPSGESFP